MGLFRHALEVAEGALGAVVRHHGPEARSQCVVTATSMAGRCTRRTRSSPRLGPVSVTRDTGIFPVEWDAPEVFEA
jgi:hypothetical protein